MTNVQVMAPEERQESLPYRVAFFVRYNMFEGRVSRSELRCVVACAGFSCLSWITYFAILAPGMRDAQSSAFAVAATFVAASFVGLWLLRWLEILKGLFTQRISCSLREGQPAREPDVLMQRMLTPEEKALLRRRKLRRLYAELKTAESAYDVHKLHLLSSDPTRREAAEQAKDNFKQRIAAYRNYRRWLVRIGEADPEDVDDVEA